MQYLEYTDGVGIYRDGVRDGNFVIDVELTETGFDGDVDVDWKNLATYTPED